MNYSTYFSHCFVYSVLTLIGPQLACALICYTGYPSDNMNATETTTNKTALCYIRRPTTQRGIDKHGAYRTLEPEKTQCAFYGTIEYCFCSTDHCNEHLHSTLPKTEPKPDSISCVDNNPRGNQSTCIGSVCNAGTLHFGDQPRGCEDFFVGNKRNGCLKKAYLPKEYTRMCFCDTKMCDPFAQSDLNETNNESQHTTDPSAQSDVNETNNKSHTTDPSAQSDPNGTTLHTINVLMTVFLAWMVREGMI